MKNQLIRLIAIILLGVCLYINMYEKDELGLMQFFAYVGLLGFTFAVGIPIIFIKNKISLSKKNWFVVFKHPHRSNNSFIGIRKFKIYP